jgi:hypothetical protein
VRLVTVLLCLLIMGGVLAACGVGPGWNPEPWHSDHPWLTDDTIVVPNERLADSRVFAEVRDLAVDSGLTTRDILIEYHGTNRMVQDGPKAGFRSMSFTASVSGPDAAVRAFVGRLNEGQPYHTLVVGNADITTNADTSAQIAFTVYTQAVR